MHQAPAVRWQRFLGGFLVFEGTSGSKVGTSGSPGPALACLGLLQKGLHRDTWGLRGGLSCSLPCRSAKAGGLLFDAKL